MLWGDAYFLSGLFEKSLPVSSDADNTLAVHGDELAEVFWVLLDFNRVFRPSKVRTHPLQNQLVPSIR